MTTVTKAWDVTEHLGSEEEIAAYLDAVFEEGDPALIKAAINDVARAKGMTEIANRTGITRAGLYKALGENGNPSFDVINGVLKALGVRLRVAV